MVKVYKTDVEEASHARNIIKEIRDIIPGSDPSFDLEDCDKVLRVEQTNGTIQEQDIRKILADYGHYMEILL